MRNKNKNHIVSESEFLSSTQLAGVMSQTLASSVIRNIGGWDVFKEVTTLDADPKDITTEASHATNTAHYISNRTDIVELITKISDSKKKALPEYILVIGKSLSGNMIDAIAYALYQPLQALSLDNEDWVEVAKITMLTANNLVLESMVNVHSTLKKELQLSAESKISDIQIDSVRTLLSKLDFDDEKIQKKHELAPVVGASLALVVINQLGGEKVFCSQHCQLAKSGLEDDLSGFATADERHDFFMDNKFLIERFIIMLNPSNGSKLSCVHQNIMKGVFSVDEVAKALHDTARTEQRDTVVKVILDKVIRHLSREFQVHHERELLKTKSV